MPVTDDHCSRAKVASQNMLIEANRLLAWWETRLQGLPPTKQRLYESCREDARRFENDVGTAVESRSYFVWLDLLVGLATLSKKIDELNQ